MKHLVGLYFLLNLVILHRAVAEYRVYQLAIIDTETGEERIFLNTLDNHQYPQYHPLREHERIELRDTWMCWERSDFHKAYCQKPANEVPDE